MAEHRVPFVVDPLLGRPRADAQRDAERVDILCVHDDVGFACGGVLAKELHDQPDGPTDVALAPISGARRVFSVRSAQETDGGRLQDIERLAGARFREVELAEVADDDPPSLRELRRHAIDGRCWVVVGASGSPVGYVMVSEVDGHAHVDQMSVHPDHQGIGAGRALIDRVREWALQNGLNAITLTTYADVPWNRPLYEHLGFRVLDGSEIGSQLATIRDAERARGLDQRPRVCMRLDLNRSAAPTTS